MSKILRRCLSLVLAFMLLASVSIGGSIVANADNKTGYGLAGYAMRAYNEGWKYVWGGSSPGAVDCSGLIYSYVGGGARVTEDMLYSSPESGYVSDGMPDIVGLGLWQPGHVGVYVGNGMAVDARDEISNVCYQSVSTKSWVMWFKVAGVSYDNDTSAANGNVGNDSSDTNSDDKTAAAPAENIQKETTLQLGSTGLDVNKLQERLKYLGYFEDNTTEYFGYVTQGALIEFQQAAGLSATGIYDSATKAALEADNAPAKQAEPESDEIDEPDTEENYEETETEVDDNVTAAESDFDEPQSNADNADENVQSVPEEDYAETDSDEFETDSTEQSSANYSEDEDSDDSESSEQSSANYPEDEVLSEVVFEPGDVSAEISEIQYVLIKLGYFDYDITGVYCDNTADAVLQFRCDYDLGISRSLDEDSLKTLYAVYEGEYFAENEVEAYAPLGVNAEASQQEEEVEDSSETDTAEVQSVTITLEGSDTESSNSESDNTEVSVNTDSEVTSETTEVSDTDKQTANTAVTSESSNTAGANAADTHVSPRTSDNTQVVFVQTGMGDNINITYALIGVGVSLVLIFFFGTIHYWNVSMEKRKQRARRATTVSVYHRSSL